MSDLARLARRLGVVEAFDAIGGGRVVTTDAAIRMIAAALGYPADDPASLAKVEAPDFPRDRPGPGVTRCVSAGDVLDGRRAWGISCQLYALVAGEEWGIGDFRSLRRLIERAAATGADFIGLNPLHALFAADPGQASPYYPSSRHFLDPLAIDVESAPGFAAAEAEIRSDRAVTAERDRLNAGPLVDRKGVQALKETVLRRCFGAIRALAGHARERDALMSFAEAGGERLTRFAVFQVIHRRLSQRDPRHLDPATWPAGLAHGSAPDVASFADEHSEDVAFEIWLQLVAARQLESAAEAARHCGMRVGLYRDLAVGVGRGSADVWSDPSQYVSGVTVGAPPDPFSAQGQDWGLVPLDPIRLALSGAAEMRDLLDANMAAAGSIRIDHAMGIRQLFWVLKALGPGAGAYVANPETMLFDMIAEASSRHRVLVVGEDLGTVPPGFRDRMAARGLLGYRVVPFERWPNGLFKRASTYPKDSLAALGTHDLPTLAGYWNGRDIEVRAALGLVADPEADRIERAVDRQRFLDALIDAEVWPQDRRDAASGPLSPELRTAAHLFVAHSPARLFAVQIEDIDGQEEMVNLPGTVDQHPNWRRRMKRSIDALFDDPRAASTLYAVDAARRER